MSDKKISIAVCISGDLRFFDVSYRIYDQWNTLFPEYNFYFFATGWDSKYIPATYHFLENYEILNPNKIPGIKDPSTVHKYAYSLFKCHELRRNSQIEFDYVFQTRSDIIIGLPTLKSILSYIEMGMDETSIIVPGHFKIDNKKGNVLLTDDNFSFGTTNAMDKYSMMFYDCYVCSEYNNQAGFHDINVRQAVYRNLILIPIGKQRFYKLYIREQTDKPKHIGVEDLKNLLDNNIEIEEITNEYWHP